MAEHLKPEDDVQQPEAVDDEELEGLAGGVYVPGEYGSTPNDQPC